MHIYMNIYILTQFISNGFIYDLGSGIALVRSCNIKPQLIVQTPSPVQHWELSRIQRWCREAYCQVLCCQMPLRVMDETLFMNTSSDVLLNNMDGNRIFTKINYNAHRNGNLQHTPKDMHLIRCLLKSLSMPKAKKSLKCCIAGF